MVLFADCLAVYFILQYFWSYYRTCYRKGYKIDFWHFWLFPLMFAVHGMLPFARSPLNVLALGPALTVHMLPWVDTAYLISAFGYTFVLLGGQLWRLKLGAGVRRMSLHLLAQPARLVMVMFRSRRLVLVVGLANFLAMAALVAYYFKVSGFGFNLRGLMLVEPALRPVANFTGFIALQVGAIAITRAVLYRERSMLLLFVMLATASIFYGSRSMITGMISSLVLVWMIKLRHRLRLWAVALSLYGVLIFAFMMDAARAGSFSLGRVLGNLGINIAFGNTFSDTRDFAIILSFWNGQFFHGLTYLAALMAFIPRFLSPFRDKWAIGVVTATMAGFSPTEHPGLRIGSFGEAYMNFGLIGVALTGLFIGYSIRLADLLIKDALQKKETEIWAYCYFILGVPPVVLMVSATASTFYTVILLYLTGWALVRLSRAIQLPLG